MENERLIEILTIVKEVFLTRKEYYGFKGFGMCFVINNLVSEELISYEEKQGLRRILIDNKPTATNSFSRFFKSELWNQKANIDSPDLSNHWWLTKPAHPQGHKIRYDYLTALIDKYSK